VPETIVFPERLFMRLIKGSLAGLVLAGILAMMPAAAFAHGGYYDYPGYAYYGYYPSYYGYGWGGYDRPWGHSYYGGWRGHGWGGGHGWHGGGWRGHH
jgi:hypothetical protein